MVGSHKPDSTSQGVVVGGHPVQSVALLRGLAAGALHGHPPAQEGGQSEHLLLIVVIPLH